MLQAIERMICNFIKGLAFGAPCSLCKHARRQASQEGQQRNSDQIVRTTSIYEDKRIHTYCGESRLGLGLLLIN